MDAVTSPSDDGIRMIDGTSVRAYHLAATLKADHQDRCLGRSRGGLTTKIHAVTDSKWLPNNIAITTGAALRFRTRIGIFEAEQTPLWTAS